MKVYTIVGNDGIYITKDKSTGKFVVTRSKNAAFRWNDYEKARNVMNNCLPKSKNNHFEISELVIPDRICAENPKPIPNPVPKVEKQEEQEEPKKKLSISRRMKLCSLCEDVPQINITTWEETLNDLIQFAQDSSTKMEKLVEELSNIDREIVDIQHYIEFTSLSSYHGYLAYKLLRSKLMKRRVIKNKLTIMKSCEEGKNGIESLRKILDAMQLVSNMNYSPRILEELFE